MGAPMTEAPRYNDFADEIEVVPGPVPRRPEFAALGWFFRHDPTVRAARRSLGVRIDYPDDRAGRS